MNFYMDDSGTRTPDRKPLQFQAKARQFFALGGILVNEEDEAAARKLHADFCSQWSISYPLHSVEIRNCKNAFSWLRRDTKEYERFMRDLSKLVTTIPVIGIACVIDRPGYDARYRAQYGRRMWHLCKTAFCISVERAAKHARRDARKLVVMPERSSKQEEDRLAAYYAELRKVGMPFEPGASNSYAPLSAEALHGTLYDLKFKSKSSPMAQIADLYLWPIAVGGYDPQCRPYQALVTSGRLIECVLDESEHASCATKYSCFELVGKDKRGA